MMTKEHPKVLAQSGSRAEIAEAHRAQSFLFVDSLRLRDLCVFFSYQIRVSMRRFLLQTLAVLLLPAVAIAQLPQANPVPGGIAIVTVALGSAPVPLVTFQDQRVLVTHSDGAWRAVVGLPLSLAAGEYRLSVVERPQAAARDPVGMFGTKSQKKVEIEKVYGASRYQDRGA